MVGGRDHRPLRERLPVEGRLQVESRGVVEERLRRGQHPGRAVGDPTRERVGLRLELVRRHHAIDQPDPLRLARVDDVGGEHQLLRAREADAAREEVRAAGVGNQADPGEQLREAGPVGRHHEIARQGQVTPRARCRSVDHGDRGGAEASQRHDRAVDRLDPRLPFRRRHRIVPHQLDVAARAEVLARAPDHHHPHARVIAESLQRGFEVMAHRHVQRVADLRPVQRDRGHAVRARGQDRPRPGGHGRLLPRLSDSARPPRRSRRGALRERTVADRQHHEGGGERHEGRRLEGDRVVAEPRRHRDRPGRPAVPGRRPCCSIRARTSSRVGIASTAPRRVHVRAPAALATRSASAIGAPAASAAARVPLKASPAPTVSIASTGKPGSPDDPGRIRRRPPPPHPG